MSAEEKRIKFQQMRKESAQIASKTTRKCENCNRKDSSALVLDKKCKGCKKVYYCNEECLMAHWNVHKDICSKGKNKEASGIYNL